MATVTRPSKRPPAMSSFCEQIKKQMEEQGLSFTQLAESSGVSRAYLYRILDGTHVPSMDIADKIAAALGLIITTAPAR